VLFLYKLYYCFHRANVSAVYQPFRPCFGCTYLHCTALCFVSELKLKLNKNRAARIVLNVPPRTPSLPLLQQLHWLPIEARISHKLCSLMYRVTNGTVPLSRRTLSTLGRKYTLLRHASIRSASRSDYNVPRFTNSSFSISAPTFWNCLPSHIRSSPSFSSFPTRLKTHCFNTSVSPLQHVT